MGSNSKKRLEDQDFMNMSLATIKDKADTVTENRKKQTVSIEWQLEEYSITVEIKRNVLSNNDVVDLKQLSDKDKEALDQLPSEEKEVVKMLANGQKQVIVAEKMNISQAKVSGIKNKNAGIIRALAVLGGALGGPAAFAAATAFAENTNKKK